jgi:hypothetical protein
MRFIAVRTPWCMPFALKKGANLESPTVIAMLEAQGAK